MRRSFIAVLVIGLLALPLSAARAGYSRFVSFGDSLTDTGNVYLGTSGAQPVSPYYYGPAPYNFGQFSNGPVWASQFSSALGLGLAIPSLLPGAASAAAVNFATGGATITGSAPGNNLATQLGLAAPLLATLPSSTLISFWAGANDIIGGIQAGAINGGNAVASGQSLAALLASDIASVVAGTARSLLVMTMPDLGLTPRFLGSANQTLATDTTNAFNAQLTLLLSGFALNPATAGADLHILNMPALLAQVQANAGTYGLSDFTTSCVSPTPVDYASTTNTACGNASAHFYWDDIHPTATVHALIAAAALVAVPEPASLGLLLVAAGGLVAVRRRR